MKHIAVDARMIQDSGIGTVIRNVLKRLISQRRDWHFCVMGNERKLQNYSWLQNKNVRLINAEAPIYSVKEQFEIPRLIPQNTDILWVPHYNIPVFYRGKIVVTVHDLFHVAMSQFVHGIHRKMYAKMMFRAVAQKADRIVCVSDFTRRELARFVSVKPEKVYVVYNGVDSFWSQPLQREKRIYEKPYILYVGNVKPHKNLRRLVVAFEKLSDQIPQNLIIVGKKEGFITGDDEVARLAEKSEGRIHFTGFVSDEDLKNYYHYADLLAFPSLYEGFGLPPLEAMAAGCRRLLCSDIPVLREIYGDTAVYVDPYDCDAIAKGIEESLRQAGKEDHALLAKYNWDVCAGEYEKIFEQILSKS